MRRMWIKDVMSCYSSRCSNTFLASVVKISQKCCKTQARNACRTDEVLVPLEKKASEACVTTRSITLKRL